MRTFRSRLATILLAVVAVACQQTEPTPATPQPGRGTFIDCGLIPARLRANFLVAEFQSMIYDEGALFIATSDGVWKYDLASHAWARSGLDGLSISALYKHPTVAGQFLAGIKAPSNSATKTVYYSRNAGRSWAPADTLPTAPLDGRYEHFASFGARPGHPGHLFATLEGPMVAVSTDGGVNWRRMNNEPESLFGYQTLLAFRPTEPNAVYIGSENPMDDAWLASYTIGSNPRRLSNFTRLTTIDQYSNHRPLELRTFPNTGNTLYVGHEGNVSTLSYPDNAVHFLFRGEAQGQGHYPYMYGLWVDPANEQHLLFGGQQNGGTDMELYETYDAGATVHRFTDKMGLQIPVVMDIVQTDTYPALLLADDANQRVRLVLYQPKP